MSDQMEAGPALNAEIAERVFGWRRDDPSSTGPEPLFIRPEGGSRFLSEIPAYSTDMSAAWTVVEHFRARGWLVTVRDMPDGFPYYLGDVDEGRKSYRRSWCSMEWMPRSTTADVRRYIYRHPHGPGATPAEAICRAALLAAEAEAEVTDAEVRAAWKLPPDAPLIPLIGGDS